MNKSYDVAVAYRIYPRISKKTIIFADDKFRLAEVCLESFKNSLGTLRPKVWALLDNCPREYRELFQKHFSGDSLEIVELPGVGNTYTFHKQIQLLCDQDFAENVYFAEDDYYYLPDSLSLMMDFQGANPDAHFITPYDHKDYYTLGLHRESHEIRWCNGRHWRTAATTCLTFLTTRTNLQRTRHIFETYARRNNDASIWMCLTKRGDGLLSPLRVMDPFNQNPTLSKLFIKSWYFGWRQILFGKRRNLWVPMPSLGTHMEAAYLAPGIDWAKVVGQGLGQLNVNTASLS